MLMGGQLICGMNATRRQLNNAMRQAAGFPGTYPEGHGEKIICLKNRHDLGLINGMFIELADIRDEDPLTLSAVVKTEEGVSIPGRTRFYKGHYDDHVAYDRERLRCDWREMRGLVESVWGYAITCHKAQGSQWENIIVYDDGLGRTDGRGPGALALHRHHPCGTGAGDLGLKGRTMPDSAEMARRMGIGVAELRELEDRLRQLPIDKFLEACFGPDHQAVYDTEDDLWIAPNPRYAGPGFGFMAIRRDRSFFTGVIPPEVFQ